MNKSVLKNELKKAICTYRFLLVLIIGVLLLTYMQVIDYTKFHNSYITVKNYLEKTGNNSFFKLWGVWSSLVSFFFHQNTSSMVANFTLYLPLLLTIPFSSSLLSENKSGYIYAMISRLGVKSYLFAKFFASFISSAFMTFIFCMYSILLSISLFPTYQHYPLAMANSGIIPGKQLLELFVYQPLVFFIYLVIFELLFSGLISCMYFMMLKFIKSSFVMIVSPFLIMFIVAELENFGILNIPMLFDIRKVEASLSPSIFMNQVIGQETPLFYIWGLFIIVLLMILVSIMMWSRKKDFL